MTDFKQELKSYSPIDLDKLKKNSRSISDNQKNSIMLYNKALENMRDKSEDIAIIELKKAVSINPDFNEAIKLLGLLYASIGEDNDAKDCFKKVLNKIPNDRKAIEYLKKIDPDFDCSSDSKKSCKDKKKKKNPSKKNKKNKAQRDITSLKPIAFILDFLKMDIAKYIVGFLAGVLVFFLITIVVNSDEISVDASSVVDDVYLNSITQEYEKEYDALLSENKVLKDQLEGLKETAKSYKNLTSLLEVDKKVSEKDYVAAADMLIALNEVKFNDMEKEKYVSLCNITMNKAANEIYSQGRVLYKKNKFSEALEKFDKVMIYDDEWKYSNATIYYIGVCHQKLNNSDKAIEAFNEVITKYPSSAFARYSKSRVNSISTKT